VEVAVVRRLLRRRVLVSESEDEAPVAAAPTRVSTRCESVERSAEESSATEVLSASEASPSSGDDAYGVDTRMRERRNAIRDFIAKRAARRLVSTQAAAPPKKKKAKQTKRHETSSDETDESESETSLSGFVVSDGDESASEEAQSALAPNSDETMDGFVGRMIHSYRGHTDVFTGRFVCAGATRAFLRQMSALCAQARVWAERDPDALAFAVAESLKVHLRRFAELEERDPGTRGHERPAIVASLHIRYPPTRARANWQDARQHHARARFAEDVATLAFLAQRHDTPPYRRFVPDQAAVFAAFAMMAQQAALL
jgi:hypothetical protein